MGACFAPNVRRLENHFGRTRSYSYVLWVELKVGSVHLEIVLILTLYTICMERVIGSNIIFGTTDGTPRGNGLSESSFWSIRR
jgi:hypothetical protein